MATRQSHYLRCVAMKIKYKLLYIAMKKIFQIVVFISCWLFTSELMAQQHIKNDFYDITVLNNAAVAVKHLPSGKVIKLTPKFTVMERVDDPKINFSGAASKFMKQEIGAVRVPHWTDPADVKTPVADFFKAASPMEVTAQSASVDDGTVKWNFAETGDFTLAATISLKNGAEPMISFEFVPKKTAWYSIGFTGMPEVTSKQFSAVWQPPVWQEKRFPEISFFSTEDMCNSLPGSMVEVNGVTTGVLADPGMFPYQLPYFNRGTVVMGTLLRNKNGNAQPMVFSPVLGSTDSKLTAGKPYHFNERIFIYPGKQTDAYIYAVKNIFQFKDYRQNVYANLNQTIENMIDFQMDDIFSRWSTDMKGFDYSTDVANTVKNVSGLHPLSAAIITDSKGIYDRRALPMIEYLISREKYLFSVNKNITRQQPSSRMKGPAVEVSELAALQQFYHNQTPLFKYYADSMSHTSRQLNLTKVSKGDDWPNLVSLYKMTGNPDYLTAAKKKADEYINWRITKKQTDFSDSGPLQAAQFWTDYCPLWMEMLNLYEVSKDKKYLDAAEDGAKLFMQYIWFYPVIPQGNITVNKGGVVDSRCIEAIRDTIPAMKAPEQTVPNWQVSQIGLTPEASNTIAWNPAIMLTQFAPHLIRLGYYTHNDFYRAVGRSAVVGRYTNYPGYDIDGEFNTVYSRPDYPLRFQNEVSYNQFYYNHVWPQISMLFDYLISDVFASSDGKIDFPTQFAEGYAYLKSNVYGADPGTFYEDKNVNLWMPRQVLKINNEQVNYLTGYGNGKFYIVFLNQSDKDIDFEAEANPVLVPMNKTENYTARIWKQNGAAKEATIMNGKINLNIKARGITAIAINDVHITPQFQQTEVNTPGTLDKDSYHLTNTAFGRVNSNVFTYGKLKSAYVWLEASNEQVSEATLKYKLEGEKKWKTITDANYPYEFSVPFRLGEKDIEYTIIAKTVNGEEGVGSTFYFELEVC